MNILKRRSWEIPEREATPEHVFLNRRQILGGGYDDDATAFVAGSAVDRNHSAESADVGFRIASANPPS